MKLLDKGNLIWGTFTAFCVALLGQYWFLFFGFLVLNIIDTITGVIKAKFYEKNESSKKGAVGPAKKLAYWIIIGIAFFISDCFVRFGDIIGVNLSFMLLFGWFTLGMYIINEIRSILENCVVMGVKVPSFLIKGLEITQKLIESKTEDEKKNI